MKKITAVASAALIAGAVLTAPPAAAAPAQQPTIVQAKKSDYPKKKRNRFWRTVKQVDPFVKYAGKKATIELGVSTCDRHPLPRSAVQVRVDQPRLVHPDQP